MRIDGAPRLSGGTECPYLPDRTFVQEHFFGTDVEKADLGVLLNAGWRRFGNFFFRPHCPGCQACEPLRLPVSGLILTASQKRVVKKNETTAFNTAPLTYRDEYFYLYENHSRVRFGKEVDRQDFEQTFFEGAAPAFITEYRVADRLAAIGFCDQSDQGLSSVYFVYHEDFSDLSLGVYSVIRESALAEELGLSYYYLGFLVRQNKSMSYKGKFVPHDVLNWETGEWNREA